MGLSDKALEILETQEVNGRAFLKLTEEKLLRHPYNLPGGPASNLADFSRSVRRSDSFSYKPLKDLKEMLATYGLMVKT